MMILFATLYLSDGRLVSLPELASEKNPVDRLLNCPFALFALFEASPVGEELTNDEIREATTGLDICKSPFSFALSMADLSSPFNSLNCTAKSAAVSSSLFSSWSTISMVEM